MSSEYQSRSGGLKWSMGDLADWGAILPPAAPPPAALPPASQPSSQPALPPVPETFAQDPAGAPPQHVAPLLRSRDAYDKTLGWQPTYQTSFELCLTEGTAVDLYTAIHQGFTRPLNEQLRQRVGHGLEDFMGQFSGHAGGASVHIDSLVSRGSRDNPDYWVASSTYPQYVASPRVWRCQIGVSRLFPDERGARFKIHIATESHIIPTQTRPVPLPSYRFPSIVGELFIGASRGLWEIRSGSAPMSQSVTRIGCDDVKDLSDAIDDRDRKAMLFVWLSHTPCFLRPRLMEFAKSLTGVGMVYELYGQEAIKKFYDGHPHILPITTGEAAQMLAFWPANHEGRRGRILQLSATHLEEMGGASEQDEQMRHWALRTAIHASKVFRPTAERGHFTSDYWERGILTRDDLHRLSGWLKVQELKYRQFERELLDVDAGDDVENLKASVEKLKQQREEDSQLLALQIQENSDLTKDNQQLSLARDEAELAAFESEVRCEEQSNLISNLKGRLEAAQGNNQYLQIELGRALKELACYQEQIKEPQNVLEALRLLGREHPQTIEVLPGAMDDAVKMVENKCLQQRGDNKKAIAIITESLPKLYTVLADASKNLDESAIKARIGCDVALSESSDTSKDPKLRALRTINYNGEEIYAQSHLKYGIDEGRQIRVHFYYHRQVDKLLIVRCVDHLPIYSSRSDGKRA